jgi:hypothetical protein
MTLVSSLVLISVLSFGWLGSLVGFGSLSATGFSLAGSGSLVADGFALQAGTLCTMARLRKMDLFQIMAFAGTFWTALDLWLRFAGGPLCTTAFAP